MKPSYFEVLKDFVEGKKDLREWPAWWQENQHIIEKNEGRTRYLMIKHDWKEGACQILERQRIAYKLDEDLIWGRCKECGEPLFKAIPHEATKEQIREFARNSNLRNKTELEDEGWLHPGVYCPNGCTEIWFSYK